MALFPSLFLYLASCPYALIMLMRRGFYALWWWGKKGTKRELLFCPCICVGNISWGGTGKSPIVGALLEYAKGQGQKAVVLTRGYGGKPPHTPYVVGVQAQVQYSGDEALMLAQAHPEATIIVDPCRIRAAKFAKSSKPDLLLLDDGFQHLAMPRHGNLVLLSPQDFLPSQPLASHGPQRFMRAGWNHVLPHGAWREGSKALHQAQAFLVKVTGPAQAQALAPLAHKYLQPYGKPLFFFSLSGQALRPVGHTGEESNKDKAPYVLVSAVGKPEQVEHSVRSFMGRDPVHHAIYGDHHAFSQEDVRHLQNILPSGAFLLCTQKDAVKLAALHLDGLPVWYLEVQPYFLSESPEMESFWPWFEGFLAQLRNKKEQI